MDFTEHDLAILNTVSQTVAENATNKGFREPPEGITEEQWNSAPMTVIRAAVYSANQHGESSEFWEAARKGALHKVCDKGEAMEALGLPPLTCGEEEIADEIIRALEKAQFFGINAAKAVAVKHAYNKSRPQKHGGKLA